MRFREGTHAPNAKVFESMSLQEFVIDVGNVPGLASQSPAPRHTCGQAIISSVGHFRFRRPERSLRRLVLSEPITTRRVGIGESKGLYLQLGGEQHGAKCSTQGVVRVRV